MNAETPETISIVGLKFTKGGIGLIVASVVMLCGLWGAAFTDCPIPKETNQAQAEIALLTAAADAYHTEYGHWPPPEDIFPLLSGKNLHGNNSPGICFYDTRYLKKWANDKPLDPWGHPYVFDGIVDSKAHFHSTGKDGIDQHMAERSDDVRDWR